ncbi:hypothetical protein [Deinococcus multiflagellatus]|uniref:Uncharacterized protein n=1 Tax=Deinococcus multiflagellatus TaxID=1656887 RepID=A0ABW1ZG23_9DEIO|nr:hypothetical protein [Deinococcus multiflagellatus]MBZ9712780.1 hypothetical protein [Deinococcus multiflagellatus]
MLSDIRDFEVYEPGWFLSMSGSGMLWQLEEQDGDVCVTLTIQAALHRRPELAGMVVTPEGGFRFVQSAADARASERFESLVDARALVLKTMPTLVWDLTVRKRPPRLDDELSGVEGVYRRHVIGDQWVWRFIGDSVDVTVVADGLQFRCVEILRTVGHPPLADS